MGASDGGEEVGMGEGHDEKIFVSVRLRPLNRKEIARNDVSDWGCINDNTIVYKNANVSVPERSMYPTAYTFDRVFSCDSTTRQVYKEGAREVALSVLTGINSSIFAYGQTSSGKTFTMTGITEYTVADIYDYVQKHKEREFLLKFSAMEIYNESVRDLLSIESTPLRLLDDPERGTIVEKLTEETLRDWNHVMELLSICEAQRQIGETSLNETSSRSHQIIRLTIESSARELLGKDNLSTLVAAVNFVDLAGSERASQSLSAGTRLKEGCHINRSLLTLGTVVRKLSKGRNGHVPFRDSKLTRILQSSLGGNARTAIICTMSPARSHVEQSRNTLLFASCAKEVSTNAQVNVIISDKALVKHLQRELARLESELSNAGSQFLTSKFSALLREKDLQIDKLEKEVKDLTLQRDAAQSQVQDILRLIGNEEHLLTRVGFDHHPHLQAQRSPDARHAVHETSLIGHPHSMDVNDITLCTSPFSDGQGVSSFNDNCVQLPGAFEENFLHTDTSSRLVISTSQFSESDSSQDLDENDEKFNGTSEDVCKEVRCIEIDECSTNSYLESNCLSMGDNIAISAPTADQEVDSPVLQADGELVSWPLKERRELITHSLTLTHTKEASELSCTAFVNPSPERPSPFHVQTKELSRSRSLSLTRSVSFKSGLLISLSSPWPENFKNNENTPPNGSEKEFTGRPQGLQSKVSALNYVANAERLLRKGSQSCMGSAVDIELEAQQQRTSSNENISNVNTGIGEMKNTAELQQHKHASQAPANVAKVMSNGCLNSVKDVGLDPMEDGFRSPSNWPSKFKRLQREIIELWHACNVSLVHRTHFFLLFQGDPTDSIYMEVELRRLSFLKDTFSLGNQTLEDGRTLTPASSLKALRHERHLLSYQMRRQLSELERERLYLKWGIALKCKHRRVQLANRLWIYTEDMDHVADSATVVAKLVGLVEPGQTSKEMFGLRFAPWSSKRSYSLKRSLLSIL